MVRSIATLAFAAEPLVVGQTSARDVVAMSEPRYTSSHRTLAFLINVSAMDGQDEIPVVPSWTLRRAKPDEAAEIRREVTRLAATYPRDPRALYEEELVPHPTVEGGQTYTALPESRWKYHVLFHDGTTSGVPEQLEWAMSLMEAEIELGFTLTSAPSGWGMSYRGAKVFHFMEGAGFSGAAFKVIGPAAVDDLRTLFDKLSRHDGNTVDLQKPLRDFEQVKELPRHSPMRVLGLFSIIESILTHKPKQYDPSDSITRQVRGKFVLVNHRLAIPLDFSCFGGNSEEKVWTKLYEYRSAIAHGDTPIFTGDLQLLGSAQNVETFLRTASRRLLRQALEEPQLVRDLKQC